MTATQGLSTCPTCGKRRFLKKAHAKAAARRIRRQGRHRLSVYRCGDFWHLGHLPDDVRHGIITRDELTPPRPRGALEEA